MLFDEVAASRLHVAATAEQDLLPLEVLDVDAEGRILSLHRDRDDAGR